MERLVQYGERIDKLEEVYVSEKKLRSYYGSNKGKWQDPNRRVVKGTLVEEKHIVGFVDGTGGRCMWLGYTSSVVD